MLIVVLGQALVDDVHDDLVEIPVGDLPAAPVAPLCAASACHGARRAAATRIRIGD